MMRHDEAAQAMGKRLGPACGTFDDALTSFLLPKQKPMCEPALSPIRKSSPTASRVFPGLILGALSLLSAFLLFQVQPIISKFILTWFCGSPGVWTTFKKVPDI